MLKRLTLAVVLTLALLVVAAVSFVIVVNTFRYPDQAPRWLATALYLALSWPRIALNSAIPSTGCTYLEECQLDGTAYFLTLAVIPLTYVSLFYVILSAWSYALSRKVS